MDDVDEALLRDGATFRKGGRYAALRDVISYHGRDDLPAGAGNGTLRLKFFSMVAAELGPLFLSRGIRVAGGDLADFLERRLEAFRRDCRSIRLDGRPPSFADLVCALSGVPRVRLRIACPDSPVGPSANA